MLENLQQGGFAGTIYPVNPKRDTVLGVKAYPSILAVPDKVDLAVIVTPPPTVPGIIHDCAQAGVRGAIIISAGFKEIGAAGAGTGTADPGRGPARRKCASSGRTAWA